LVSFAILQQASSLSGVDDRSLISILVKAVQELIVGLNSLEATIAGFANNFITSRPSKFASDQFFWHHKLARFYCTQLFTKSFLCGPTIF
jgi:hypothetical protein